MNSTIPSDGHRALIFEPNPWHFETLPSYVHYLQDLKYHITLLVDNCFPNEDVLGALHTTADIIRFDQWNNDEVQSTLQSPQYDLIWITSLNECDDKDVFTFIKELNLKPYDGLFGTVHSIEGLAECTIDKHPFCMLATLSNMKSAMPSMDRVSLAFFNSHHAMDKQDKLSYRRRYLVSGKNITLKPLYQGITKQKSYDSSRIEVVYCGSSAYRLEALKNYVKSLITYAFPSKGRYSKSRVPQSIFDFIYYVTTCNYKGLLSFQDLWREVEKADFLLTCFTGNEHEVFSRYKTSGTAMLSLAFGKPMIVSRDVAEAWGFDESLCIMYEKDVSTAISRSLCITSEEYAVMSRALRDECARREKESVALIEEAIDSVHA